MIFDVLVVGETPAAMASAALLVRKGLKVAWVVPAPSDAGDEKSHANPKVPDVVWDLLPQPLVREVLERLGVPYRHLEKGEHRGGGIQIVTPEFRTCSLDGILEIRRELKRIFGLEDQDLDKIFPRVQAGGGEEFLKKYWGEAFKGATIKKSQALSLLGPGESISPSPFQIDGIRSEPALRRFFELGIYAQSYLCQWVFPRSLVRHFLHNLGYLNIFAQGRLVSPEEIFKEVFQMGDGEIFHAETGTFMEFHGEKGISLWLNEVEEVVNGSVCLVAASPEDAPDFFEKLHIPPRRWHAKRDPGETAYAMANIIFEIGPRGIPGGMGDNLILYTGEAEDPFSPLDLAFLTLEKTGESGSHEGHLAVFYEGMVEASQVKEWAGRQIERLEVLFPFMASHITLNDVLTPQGHPMSPARYYYFGTRKRRLGTTWVKDGILGKNAYFMGRRQLDYMGLEGEIVTAFRATRWALDRLTKL